MSNVDDVISRFNQGFLDPFDGEDNLELNVEFYEYEYKEYKKFLTGLRKKSFNNIEFISLFTDEAFNYGDRRIEWGKYDFTGDNNKHRYTHGIDIMAEPPYYDTNEQGIERVKELIGW